MKLFTCDNCEQVIFFESVQCTHCGHTVAFLPDLGVMSALEVDGSSGPTPAGAPRADLWRTKLPAAHGTRYRLCRNSTEHEVCNWAVAESDPLEYCRSCRLNHMIPNLADAKALEGWHRIEIAKRRLLFTLLGLRLPIETKAENPEGGLAFDFLKEGAESKVFTGHSDGLITINIAEADNPFRERLRERLGETYRTLLGHMRHESGHYYWDRLIQGSPRLTAFRELFGDESASYEEARERHYKEGPVNNWSEHFVSSYASMHPWEDWAETWAHYLHMVDVLQTARSFGMSLQAAPIGAAPEPELNVRRVDPHAFDEIIRGWFPLTVALNSMNRSFGTVDCYPFILTQPAIDKLRFVHETVEEHAKSAAADAPAAAISA